MKASKSSDPVFSCSKPVTAISSFEDLAISDALLRGIFGYGFEAPSAVQRLALPAVLTGEDGVVQARSGSG